MGPLTTTLAGMGTGQLLLATAFLASYALALGRLTGARGRLPAVAITIVAAACFAGASESWQAGVVLVSFGLIGMGVFAGVAWTLWTVLAWNRPPDTLVPPVGL
jgi:hypothetical protein